MKKSFSKLIEYQNKPTTMTVYVRFDDEGNNGYNTFAITGRIDYNNIFGPIHKDIKTHFPELAKYIKWHLTSTDHPIQDWAYLAQENYLGCEPDDTNKNLLKNFLADMNELFK